MTVSYYVPNLFLTVVTMFQAGFGIETVLSYLGEGKLFLEHRSLFYLHRKLNDKLFYCMFRLFAGCDRRVSPTILPDEPRPICTVFQQSLVSQLIVLANLVLGAVLFCVIIILNSFIFFKSAFIVLTRNGGSGLWNKLSLISSRIMKWLFWIGAGFSRILESRSESKKGPGALKSFMYVSKKKNSSIWSKLRSIKCAVPANPDPDTV